MDFGSFFEILVFIVSAGYVYVECGICRKNIGFNVLSLIAFKRPRSRKLRYPFAKNMIYLLRSKSSSKVMLPVHVDSFEA